MVRSMGDWGVKEGSGGNERQIPKMSRECHIRAAPRAGIDGEPLSLAVFRFLDRRRLVRVGRQRRYWPKEMTTIETIQLSVPYGRN